MPLDLTFDRVDAAVVSSYYVAVVEVEEEAFAVVAFDAVVQRLSFDDAFVVAAAVAVDAAFVEIVENYYYYYYYS